MNKTIKVLKKITAIILTMVIVVFNIPMESLYATDNASSNEEVTVKITVVDGEGGSVEEPSFKVNGNNSITSKDRTNEIDNEYTLVINKVETDLLITVTAEDDVEISGERYYQTYTDVIEYNGAEEYTATLKKYADLSNNELEFINGVYTLDDVMYNASRPDDNNYVISFPYEVECEIEVEDEGAEDNPEISKVDNSYNWMLEYNRPGEYVVKISSVDDSVQFEDTQFKLIVGNEIEFLYEVNKVLYKDELDNNTLYFDKEDGKITKVKKIISSENETFKLTLSGLYTDDISYTLNEGAKSTINNEGTVDICACETIIVTAVCNNTKVKASYELTIEPKDKDMTLFDDENGNGEKDEDEIYISDDSKIIEFNALEDIGETIKVSPNVDLRWNSVKYESSDDNVATVDENTGRVTIKGVGETTITVIAKSYWFWESWEAAEYKIKVNAADVVAVISDDREDVRLNQGDVLHLKDMSDNAGETIADVTIDADTNKEILKLPLDIELFYEVNGKDKKVDISEDEINIVITSNGLDIEDYTITNVDDVVRNEAFDVYITISDSKGRFESITTTIKVLLESSRTNNKDEADNEYYYVESGLKTGLDGKTLWKIDEETGVLVKGNTINEGTDDEYTYQIGALADGDVKKEYDVSCGLLEPYNKEHKIYVMLKSYNYEITRLYFGVDYEAPTCNPETDIEYTSESISKTSYGILSNDSVAVTIRANDNGGNIFDAILYDGVKEIAKLTPEVNEYGEATFTYTFDKDTYKGCNDNLRFVLRDLAGNTKEYELDTIVIDENAPMAYIAEPEGLKSWKDKTDKEYFSNDVIFNVLVTDLLDSDNNRIEANSSSGIKSYDVYINGTQIDDLSVNNLSELEKCPEKTFTIDTSKYSKNEDGSITIKICNIVDMAGNINLEGRTRTIYIDNENPTASFVTVNIDGKENRTGFGNFYNNKVTYVFEAKDNMTGIESAVFMIGDTICKTSVDNNRVTAVVDLNVCGNAKLTITDHIGHITEYMLSDIKDATNSKVFTSDYVLIDNRAAKVSFDDIRATDKGNWYNSDVAYTLNISDVYNGSLSSGIADVSIMINGNKYNATFNPSENNTKGTVKVNIDRAWIDKVINANGSYTVEVMVTDNAGNVETYPKTIYIDTVAPVISDLTGVVNDSINTGVVTLDVEVLEKHFNQTGNNVNVSVKKTLDGVTTDYAVEKFTSRAAKSTKSYTFREDGTYTVVVSAEDAAGNKAVEKAIAFTIDNTAPLVDISGVKENVFYTGGRDVVIGVIESNYRDMNVVVSIEKELNGVKTVIDSQTFNKTAKSSTLSQKFSEEGTYTIKVDAVDAAGNVAITRTVRFTVDNTSPSIEITGVKNGAAYKGDLMPNIKIQDNYYKSYDVKLTKSGIYLDENGTSLISENAVDVKDTYIERMSVIKNGVESKFNEFAEERHNDGIYKLVVTATDYAGRTTTKEVIFSVNRFGSVFTYDDNLTQIKNTYNTSVDKDLMIYEYNADKILEDSISVNITRDGSVVDDVKMEKIQTVGENGWYQNGYVISKENFKADGIYVITVSSKDAAGNSSGTIAYDDIRFSVDTTKPDVVKMTNLKKSTYNEVSHTVDYEVFDSIGLSEIRIYLNGNVIQTVTGEELGGVVTSYAGSFTISEDSNKQHIRIEVVDAAGNVIDSDNEADIKTGKIVSFEKDITVTTNPFVRWYSNTVLFYGSIATCTAAVGGTVGLLRFRRKRRIK